MSVATCPTCLGDGGFDERDCNALLKEYLPAHVLARIPGIDTDWLVCSECEGTGIVTAHRAAEIEAWAVAFADQALARYREENP